MNVRTEPRLTARTVWIVLGNAFALVAGVAILWQLRTILSWLLVALFVALALDPPVRWLMRRRIRRGWAILIVMFLLLGLCAAMLATLVPMLIDQAEQLVHNAPAMLRRFEHWGPVRWLLGRVSRAGVTQQLLNDGVGGVAGNAFAVVRSLLEGIFATVTIVTLAAFMLVFGEPLFERILGFLPPERRVRVDSLARRMSHVVGGYVAGTFTVAAIGGAVMGITLAVLGVPYFLPLALVMTVLGIIPFLGSLIGAILLIGMTLASEGMRDAVICAVVFIVYQRIENDILHPLVQRRTMQLNPLVIAVSVLAGAALAGIVGALLALPIAGAIKILLEEALAGRQTRWARERGREPIAADGHEVPLTP